MKQSDEDRINENAAVYRAMIQAGFKDQRRKPTEAEFARRYGREAARQQRRYCNAFALWRSCRQKRCRRAQSCLGYVTDCLTRALGTVPPQRHVQARNALKKGVPRNIGAPERKARENLPAEFYKKRG